MGSIPVIVRFRQSGDPGISVNSQVQAGHAPVWAGLRPAKHAVRLLCMTSILGTWIRRLAASSIALAVLATPVHPGAEPPFRLPPSWRDFRAVITRADSLVAQRAYATADAYLDSLVAVLRQRGDQSHLVQVLVRRGGGRVFRGMYARGEPDLREALDRATAIHDTLGEIMALQYLAYGLGERGNTRASRPLWTRMLERSRARGDRSHAGWALMGLGYCDWRDGRAAAAQPLYRRSIIELQAGGDIPGLLEARTGYINTFPDGAPEVAAGFRQLIEDAHRARATLTEGNALYNLANYEIQRGDPELALELMRRAEEAFRTTSVATRWTAVMARGLILSDLGRDAEAAAIVGPVAVMARRTGNWKLASRSLELLAQTAANQGRDATADSLRREVLAFADSLPPGQVIDSADALARSLLAHGRPAEGLALLDRYLPPGRSTDAASTDIEVATTAARMLLALGRPSEAIERLRAVAPLVSADDPSGADIQLELQFAEVFRARRQPDSTLAHMRRARRQLLGRRQRPRSFEQRERRGSGSAWFAGQYVADVLAAPSAGPTGSRAQLAFDDLQAFKARTLAERLSRTSTAGEEEQSRHTATLATLRARVLGGQDVLLDVYEGFASSVLFAVTRDRLVVVTLPAAQELETRDVRLTDLASDPRSDPAVLSGALRSAAADLLGEAAPLVLAARRVLIAPDASTIHLPWAALLAALAPERTSEVVLVPSATWLAAAPRRDAVLPQKSLLALAGSRNARGDRLAGAEREVRWLAATYDGVSTQLTGSSRTAEALAPELARYPLLHLAGHATSDPGRPWRAGLRLGEGDTPDDYLRAGGIARQRLGTRLVVLSACGSLGSGRNFGEGALGLSAGFIAAGSSSVIATLWPVSDATGEAFAHAFYPALARGRTVSAALGEAQQTLRGTPATAAVADWGAFVLVGRPDTRVSLRERIPPARRGTDRG